MVYDIEKAYSLNNVPYSFETCLSERKKMDKKILEYTYREFEHLLNNDKAAVISTLRGQEKLILTFEDSDRHPEGTKLYDILETPSHPELRNLFNSDDDKNVIFLDEIKYLDKKISRSDFSDWFFLSDTIFNGCEFQKDAAFWGCSFYGPADFLLCSFNQLAGFGFSIFHDECDFNHSWFRDKASFTGCIFKGKTDFVECHFYEDALFNGCNFSGFLTLTRSSFDLSLYFDIHRMHSKLNITDISIGKHFKFDLKKLTEDEKMKTPNALVLEDCEQTKWNLHSLKELAGKSKYYDEEDFLYRWYKKYERKCDPRRSRKLLAPLEWLLIDKMTGYFTKPSRVFFTIIIFLLFSLSFYLVTCFGLFGNNFGDLVTYDAEGNKVYFSELAADENSNKAALVRDIAYFNGVTFTTIGYGDIQPTGFLRIFCGIEGFVALFLIPLFLVTLGKKILW